MARVFYDPTAKADLSEIAAFYMLQRGQEATVDFLIEIREQARNLADNPLVDRPVENLPGFQQFLFRKREIKFYYRRLGPKSIRVFRIYGARRKPLDPNEIVS